MATLGKFDRAEIERLVALYGAIWDQVSRRDLDITMHLMRVAKQHEPQRALPFSSVVLDTPALEALLSATGRT